MQVLGNNDRLGGRKTNLAGNRHALPASEKTERFPLGVLGLIPIVTARRGGSKEVVYAFKDEADDQALVDAAYAVNDCLQEAADRARHRFLVVDGIQIAVPAQGWGFTRAEYSPFDKRGNPSDVPMRLHIETCSDPGAQGTLGATVDYNGNGNIVRVGVREYSEHGNYIQVIATFPYGSIRVEKVESVVASTGNARLLYKARA